MRAEEYSERKETLDTWPIHIVTYRIGDRYYCARAEGPTREQVERAALEKAQRYLRQTRRFPTAT